MRRKMRLDVSYGDLLDLTEALETSAKGRHSEVVSIEADHNRATHLPDTFSLFTGVISVNISHNQLVVLSPSVLCLTNLTVLDVRGNLLNEYAIPKDLSALSKLEELNLSGNKFTKLDQKLTALTSLKRLYLGGNLIDQVTRNISQLFRLEILYLGGNQISTIPAEIGCLSELSMLSLASNQIRCLPSTIGYLYKLKSLLLNDNQLSTLPFPIVRLQLQELAIRNNPMILNFIRSSSAEVPSLQELAGRVVKRTCDYRVQLPSRLVCYLDSAKHCVNPRCQGVYFTSKVDHVKFVDLCGMFHVPMLQYLCSPRCSSPEPRPSRSDEASQIQKVQLG